MGTLEFETHFNSYVKAEVEHHRLPIHKNN